jgi:hypothetical protein
MAEGIETGARSSEVEVRPGAWLVQRRRTRWFALGALLYTLGFVAMVASTTISHPPLSGEATGAMVGVGVFLTIFCAPALVVAWRVERAGLWIGPDEVVIRGPLRSWHIPTAEAGGFEPGVQQGAGNGTPCPLLTRPGKRPVGVWALGREGLVWNFNEYLAELKSLCDSLDQTLEAVRLHPAPGRAAESGR